jgi:hypothetical protein
MQVAETLIKRRHLNCEARAFALGQFHLEYSVFKEVVSQSNGHCFYCGKMMIEQGHPRADVWSIDHKISMCNGGANSRENLVIACVECNLIKSTMSFETFIELLTVLPPHLKARVFNELYRGSFANKLEREKIISHNILEERE